MVVSICARKVLRGDFFEESGVEVAGVVHEDVDPAEPLDGGPHGRFRRGGVGDVELHGQQVLACADGLGNLFRVAAGGDHGVAGGEGCLRDVGSHAAAGAGDEPDLLVFVLLSGFLLSHVFATNTTLTSSFRETSA